jgi:tetratricopeptide (TPR) repeat protein
MNTEDDIISRIRKILSRYYYIASEQIGPWSEVSEVMEQEREANSYISGINISKFQDNLAQTIRNTKDPWKYIEFMVSKYQPTWVVQPYIFLNSIIECDTVRFSITEVVSNIASRIRDVEAPGKILNFLIKINPKNRENPQIIDIVRNMMESEQKIDSFLISHRIILNQVEAKVVAEIEEYVDRLPYIPGSFDVKVKKNTTYALGSSSRIKWGYYVKNGKIFGLGLNNKEISTIPESIGKLTNIRILSLNSIGISTLPESIGNLTELEGLYLDSNKLKKLPRSIGNCTKLQEIYIRSNKLKNLPSEIGKLHNLHRIMLNDNPLTSLPSTFQNLINLEDLHIQNTKLSLQQITPLRSLENLNLLFTYYCMAGNLIRDGKTKEAIKAYKELLSINPDYSDEVLYNLGNMLNSLGRYKEAEQYLQNAVNFNRYKVQALISLGYTYYFQNILDQAEITFKMAFEQTKKKDNKILILINLGGLYLKQDKLKEAEKALFKALDVAPKNGEICYNLSCLFARKNDSKSCLKYLKKALKFGATLLAGIDNDDDFDSIRSSDEFQDLVSKYKASIN